MAGTRDPTQPTAALADALKADLGAASGVGLRALVVGADEAGVALVGTDAASARVVRKGSAFADTVDGVRVTAEVRSVTPAGVELVSEADATTRQDAASPRIFLPGSFTPLAAPTNAPAEFLRHLECEKVPIDRLTRLIADQTGVNIAVSDAAAAKSVSIFLRNVTAEAAVEEICRATGLWFRRDPEARTVRITTMAEYEDNLSSFREETTRTFTLLYPNVVEIASVIYGLYPERTLISLGEEAFNEDDEYDLARRFRRFRVIEENGNSSFMDMQAPRSSSSGNEGGDSDFSYSRGSVLSRLTQWDQLRDRQRLGGSRNGRFASLDSVLSASEAKKLETSLAAANTNAYVAVYQNAAQGAANIFVTMSRKNNLLVIRTSDMKVMDEITRLIRELDVPTPMVLLEMRVLELQLDDEFDATVEWTFNTGGDATKLHEASLSGSARQSALAVADPTFAFVAASKHIINKVQMMARDGKVKTLATPTLLVANNEVSRIFSGDERPIVTGWTAGSTLVSDGVGTKSDTIPTLEFKDIGNMLLVSPNINADKTVTLRLLQEESSIGGKADIEVYSTVDDDGTSRQIADTRQIDYVTSRSITGTFVAKDGETVMAGGLIKETESEQYYRTPILGSIPLLGWLFRGTEKVKNRTEMIILIKPHVVMTPMEGGRISSELMKELSDHPASDGRGNMNVFRRGNSKEK